MKQCPLLSSSAPFFLGTKIWALPKSLNQRILLFVHCFVIRISRNKVEFTSFHFSFFKVTFFFYFNKFHSFTAAVTDKVAGDSKLVRHPSF